MTRFEHAVVAKFGASDSPMGNDFIAEVNPPFYEGSAHEAFLTQDDDAIPNLVYSYGHRLPKKKNVTRLPGATLTQVDWVARYRSNSTYWNAGVAPGAARLTVMHTQQIGAVLCLARKGFSGRPFITIVACPTITPVDILDSNHLGACDWKRTVGDEVTQTYFNDTVRYSHAVLGSVASFSSKRIPTTLGELEDQARPVMMTPVDRFAEQVATESMDDTGPYKTLFLPPYSDPAVGVFWPIDIGYDAFLDSISGTKAYAMLVKWVKDNKDLVTAWLTAVATKPDEMVVTMSPVDALWDVFPCPKNLDDETTADARRVSPLQFQRNLFLSRMYYPMVFNGPGSTHEDEARRKAMMVFFEAIEEQEVQFMQWQLPPYAMPFIPHLFTMKKVPLIADTVGLFLEEDRDTQVPDIIRRMPCVDVSSDELTDDEESTSPTQQAGTKPTSTPTGDDAWSRAGKRAHGVTPSPHSQPPNKKARVESPDSVKVTGVRRPPPESNEDAGNYAGWGGSLETPLQRDKPSAGQLPWSGTPRQLQYDPPNSNRSKRDFDSFQRGQKGWQHPALQSPPRDKSWSSHGKGSMAPLGLQQGGLITGQFYSPSKHSSRVRPPTQGWDTGSSSFGHFAAPPTRLDSMRDASVATPEKVERCPIIWIYVTLLSATPIQDHGLWRIYHGDMVDPQQYALVREPTSFARENVFAVVDQNVKMEHHFRQVVLGRYNYGQEFHRMTPLALNSLMALDVQFIKKLFNISLWQTRPSTSQGEADCLHVLDFPRLLDSTLPKTKLPAAGFKIGFAKQVFRLVYYLFELPGVENVQGQLSDRFFHKTAFGETLGILCGAPYHEPLYELWEQRPRQATALLMSDLMQLLDLVVQFGMVRTMSGKTTAFTLLESQNAAQASQYGSAGPFVATSVEIPTSFGSRNDNFLVHMERMKQYLVDRWTRPFYNGGEPMWSQQEESLLVSVASTSNLSSSDMDDDGTTKRKRRKTETEKKKIFTAQKPLFKFLKECTEGRTPQEMLKDVANVTRWPTMAKPDGAKGKEGMRQICFCCAFESSKTCKDMFGCKPNYKSRYAGVRLHIDLADTSKWGTDAYKPKHWKALVDFQRQWHEWIRPTEELKALYPDGDWRME